MGIIIKYVKVYDGTGLLGHAFHNDRG